MILTIVVILVALWLLGQLADFGGSLIHLILVIAAIIFIYNMIAGRRTRL